MGTAPLAGFVFGSTGFIGGALQKAMESGRLRNKLPGAPRLFIEDIFLLGRVNRRGSTRSATMLAPFSTGIPT
jgi:hypothetical protein